MMFLTMLIACSAAPQAPDLSTPDTDGGKAAQAVKVEAQAASKAADELVQQMKAAEPVVAPVAPVEPAPVAPPAAK